MLGEAGHPPCVAPNATLEPPHAKRFACIVEGVLGQPRLAGTSEQLAAGQWPLSKLRLKELNGAIETTHDFSKGS